MSKSVAQLKREANARDKQTAKEQKTLTKKHNPHVTNKATPSRIDTNFKNTRTEVGPTAGDKTIAPKKSFGSSAGNSGSSGGSKKSFFGKSFGSSSSPPPSSGGGGKFCSNCGAPKGGKFCSQCGSA